MNLLKAGALSGKKTYVTAAVGIITAIGAYLTGDIEAGALGEIALPLLAAIFLRKRISEAAVGKLQKLNSKNKKGKANEQRN